MGSIEDIMQLCRLCLVKDQVNIPIFDETSDIRQTFMKINQCLPVKVSRDDNLPKKICDGCSYKLDMLYVFRNTTVDSEKQLITWLSQLGSCSLSQNVVKDGVTKPEIMVKQETFETTDTRLEGDNSELNVDAQQELGVDAHSYIIQQQKLPYQQDYAAFGEPSGSTGIESEEPAPKRAKRAVTVKKHVPAETEEDVLDTAMQITKAEQEEDSDDVDQPDYVEAPSTSADDQPGPSGVGKGTIEAPCDDASIKIEEQKITETFAVRLNRGHMCRKCAIIFGTVKLLKKHRRDVHWEKIHSCPTCQKRFKTMGELKHHSDHHLQTKTYFCEHCKEYLKTRLELYRHNKVHREQLPEWRCCGRRYRSEETYKRHQNSCHTESWKCDTCDKSYKEKRNLELHKETHSENYKPAIFPCQQCNKQFCGKHSLLKHVRSIHEGKPKQFICEVCGKVLVTPTSLKYHMDSHGGEKPFMCNVCTKRFSRKAFLKVHLRVHTKEKPYVCGFCNKKYSQRSSLTTHVRAVHSGEKPYECVVCSKCFISRTVLNAHLKTHSVNLNKS